MAWYGPPNGVPPGQPPRPPGPGHPGVPPPRLVGPGLAFPQGYGAPPPFLDMQRAMFVMPPPGSVGFAPPVLVPAPMMGAQQQMFWRPAVPAARPIGLRPRATAKA